MTARRTAVVSVVAVGAVLLAGGLFALPALSGQTGGPAEAPTTDSPAPNEVNGTVVSPVNDSLVLETRANETVDGVTDLDPGATLTLRIRSDSAENPFLYQRQTTVRENGTFAVQVDLSNVEGNATATVSVRHDGAELTNRTAQIRHVPGASDGEADDESSAGTQFDYDGDALTVRNDADQSIRGTTDLDPGTNVTIRARSTGSSTPFIRQRVATVADDGSFTVTMDFESLPDGTEFVVRAVHDDETLAEADARVE
ncbi:hypothetical protein EGH21_02890 [Halomicroarcula sp. F13]|uniref:Uncharacterized protein n=1 Tax=Haloarcula rubra TaxID=2487747 RepID=A0AAW4PNK0_9EURY|nr:BGTF surface domain-containing protein [Halomicroarcula rubra]MBX0321972.1 hypothetical protein [Halomicroarcula rubra]